MMMPILLFILLVGQARSENNAQCINIRDLNVHPGLYFGYEEELRLAKDSYEIISIIDVNMVIEFNYILANNFHMITQSEAYRRTMHIPSMVHQSNFRKMELELEYLDKNFKELIRAYKMKTESKSSKIQDILGTYKLYERDEADIIFVGDRKYVIVKNHLYKAVKSLNNTDYVTKLISKGLNKTCNETCNDIDLLERANEKMIKLFGTYVFVIRSITHLLDFQEGVLDRNMKHALFDIESKMKLKFPIEIDSLNTFNFFQVASLNVNIMRNHIISQITVPLFEKRVFQVYKIIPLPVFTKEHSALQVHTIKDLIAVDLKTQEFILLTGKDLINNKKFNKTWLYTGNNHISKQLTCESNLFFRNKREKCQITSIKNPEKFYVSETSYKGEWLFSSSEPLKVEVDCITCSQNKTINGSLLINLPKTCRIKIENNTFYNSLIEKPNKYILPNTNILNYKEDDSKSNDFIARIEIGVESVKSYVIILIILLIALVIIQIIIKIEHCILVTTESDNSDEPVYVNMRPYRLDPELRCSFKGPSFASTMETSLGERTSTPPPLPPKNTPTSEPDYV